MEIRLKGLAAVDPLAVPLPNGTEVTTRVDRLVGDRTVPRGCVGRVVGTTSGGIDVAIIGVGTLCYLRNELTPRKAGQLRYAQRRSVAWDALHPNVVLETVVGSRAWGLSDENSDTDLRGIFVVPQVWNTALAEPPKDLVSTDGSSTFWECRKAIQQALRADPNTLEVLFVAGARPLDVMGRWILEERDAFVSRLIYASFGRYALSQLKKLTQSMRLAEHRSVILEWLQRNPVPTLDEVSKRLVAATFPPSADPADAELQAKTYIKQLYRSLHDQGLIHSNDFESLVVFARNHAAGLELPRELRPKNAYNLLRLIVTAVQWLRTGEVSFVVEGVLRERLLSIKRGEVPLAEVLLQAEALTTELDAAHKTSRLPRTPDVARADALLRRIGDEVARRWTEKVPGPFGRDAAVPALAAWTEETDHE